MRGTVDMNDPEEKKQENWIGNVSRYLSISTNMAGAVIFGLIAGHYLDKWLGTYPWMTMIMLLLGVASGFKMTYDTVFKNGDSGFPSTKKSDEGDH
jgi:ATP synthase protein I